MQWMTNFEEEVEGLEEVRERRESLLQMAETEARGRQGVGLEIFPDWPSAGKEREAIAAIRRKGRREGGELCYWDLDLDLDLGRGEDGLAMVRGSSDL
ncbi:hypothetical protein F2Q68_00042136 [Brassica cretica]|uniref:Uncharacterized protein n=1 Tax=Brassica cretica TaxID=69181 RepID=A0A8S9MJZ4_BRACR|nr:hypothetical protein F2Q68_00042136 [Brassica cretica]